jgi:hypothetical protein
MRRCEGYEKRLSWPRANDTKRAMTCESSPVFLFREATVKNSFVNTTWRDLEIYHGIASQAPSKLWSPFSRWSHPVGAADTDLVSHFYHHAHPGLVTFDANTSRMRDMLLNLALLDDTSSARSLLFALLAFSSLHHSGPNERSAQLKLSSLHHLAASPKGDPELATEAAQQVAASMLLSAFDTLTPSATSGEWIWYTKGAVDIIQASSLKRLSHESNVKLLLGWTYYHSALSRFPLHHWKRKRRTSSSPTGQHDPEQAWFLSSLNNYRPVEEPLDKSHVILNLLSEACETLLDPRDPRSQDGDYQLHLQRLEKRLLHLPGPADYDSSQSGGFLPQEIFQLSTRIYLARASTKPGEAPADLEPLIDMAFAGPIRDCFCPHFFPLFIVACEAQTEERRAAIISLIDRTSRDSRVRNRDWLRNMVHSIWVHQDLHSDEDLLVDYTGAMDAIISSSDSVPSFV